MKKKLKKTKPQYLYHITHEHWGNNKLLYPRAKGINRGDYEPYIRRICVCPTIEGCLTALGAALLYGVDIQVYRTMKQEESMLPYEVTDSYITGEKWLVRPTHFSLYGVIKAKELPDKFFLMGAGSDNYDELVVQEKMLLRLKKMNLSFLRRKYYEW